MLSNEQCDESAQCREHLRSEVAYDERWQRGGPTMSELWNLCGVVTGVAFGSRSTRKC